MVKSVVWKHFSVIDKENATCRYCQKSIKTCGNTSNLKDNLRAKHKDVNIRDFDHASKRSRTASFIQDESSTDTILTPATTAATDCDFSKHDQFDSAINEQKEGTSYQETISRTFKNITACNKGGVKYDQITNDILYMMCKDYEPFSLLERKGFQQFMKNNFPHYIIPCINTMKKYLEDKFSKVSENYKELIENCNSLTLTCDI